MWISSDLGCWQWSFPPQALASYAADSVVVAGLAWPSRVLAVRSELRGAEIAQALQGMREARHSSPPTVDRQLKAKTIKHVVRMSFSSDASITRYLAPTEIVGVSGAL